MKKILALLGVGAAGLAGAMLLSGGGIAQMAESAGDQVWDAFGGNQQAQKYSTASQITPDNVKNLQKAWEVHTGDVSHGKDETSWGATPLFVNNTVYVGTPKYKIFAVEPDTGKQKWVYDAGHDAKADNQGFKNRGVAYWAASNAADAGQPCQKIVYIGTVVGTLHAVDADTGKLCKDFGNGGVLDVNQWNTVNNKWNIGLIQPPAVYKDTLILGWAGLDWVFKTEDPGTVFGIDARTGKLKWTFDPIPKDMQDQTGTANVWAGISVDPETGLVFLPVSSPSPNYYGGDRLKEMPMVTSTTALNAETGAVVWSRQLIHHDIWDLDINSAPTLLDIKKDGQTIPALVQATKMGFLFVLNRNTGEPVYPIEERPYPASDVPGEVAAKTQPYVALTEPTVPDKTPDVFPLSDIASFGECSRWKARIRDEGRYTPPSLRGSIAFPGKVGGVEWGGGAVDPVSQTYVVNSNNVVQVYTLVPRADADKFAARRQDAHHKRLVPRSRVRLTPSAAELPQPAGECRAGRRLTATFCPMT